jgi:hypothetical protein
MNNLCNKLTTTNATFKLLDQAELLTEILIKDGRRNPMEECFQMTHDDVLITLELIRDQVIRIQNLVSDNTT